MNRALFVALFALPFASNAMASNKICFGSTKNDDTKGVVLSVEVERTDLTIKTLNTNRWGDLNYNGTYPSLNRTIKGRDGVVYLTYEGERSEYQDIIMVNPTLLKEGTTGLIQIRARGEGFFNSTFFCKDPR